MLCLSLLTCFSIMQGQDWAGIPVPVDPGAGNSWQLLDMSDDFNYHAPADHKGPEFLAKWDDWYHNPWTGPGLTIWDREHSFVQDGQLQIIASRVPNTTNKVHIGIIHSNQTVQYPVYIEARTKISNSVLASNVWLLSPDDTQEIDIQEAYGSSYSEGAQRDQTWFAERIHISHHVFIREPFQDYQPTDPGSWYRDGTLWRADFHRYGVFWRDPWHLEYYIDGKLVRTVSGPQIIDPLGYTGGTGLNKPMDVILDSEDHGWRSKDGITPTDQELANRADHTYRVDWIRMYQLVDTTGVTSIHPGTTAQQLILAPNPVHDDLYVEASAPLRHLTLVDLNGKLLTQQAVSGQRTTLRLSQWPAGVYLLQATYRDGTRVSKKIFKQK